MARTTPPRPSEVRIQWESGGRGPLGDPADTLQVRFRGVSWWAWTPADLLDTFRRLEVSLQLSSPPPAAAADCPWPPGDTPAERLAALRCLITALERFLDSSRQGR